MKSLALLSFVMVLTACQTRLPPDRSASTAKYRGHEYAQATCSSCHAISPGSTSSPNPQAPPFASIVNTEGLSRQTLNSWLRDAHNYPGEMIVQVDERMIDDLVTYMLTLQDPRYRPTG